MILLWVVTASIMNKSLELPPIPVLCTTDGCEEKTEINMVKSKQKSTEYKLANSKTIDKLN